VDLGNLTWPGATVLVALILGLAHVVANLIRKI